MLILCSRIQSSYSWWCRNEMEREAGNLISGRRRKVNSAGQRQDRIVSGNYFRSSSNVRLRKKKKQHFRFGFTCLQKKPPPPYPFLTFPSLSISSLFSTFVFSTSSFVPFFASSICLSFLCSYFRIFVHLIDINCCPKIWSHFLVNRSLIGSGWEEKSTGTRGYHKLAALLDILL